MSRRSLHARAEAGGGGREVCGVVETLPAGCLPMALAKYVGAGKTGKARADE
jgi:hypothetical protein